MCKMTKPAYSILLLAFLLFNAFSIKGQEDKETQLNTDLDNPTFKDRLVFGGGLGLQFGTVTFIDISPMVGYRLTKKLESGVGLTYKYYKYNDFYKNLTTGEKIDLKSHMLGGSVYTRYYLLDRIFAHVEFERLNYKYQDIYESAGQIVRKDRSDYVSSLFVGGGLTQRLAGRANLFIMALWNLTEEPNTPYNNPVIRMGVLVGH